jgi:hypothetical protein
MKRRFKFWWSREQTARWAHKGGHSTAAFRSERHLRTALNDGLGADPPAVEKKIASALQGNRKGSSYYCW